MAHTRYYVQDKNGKTRVRSTTTLINEHLGWNKQVLIGWTRKQCLNGNDSSKVLREAGKIGTLAHKLIECSITETALKDMSKFNASEISKAKTAFYGFLKWQDDVKKKNNNKIKFLENEIKLVSNKYKYGGTCDGIVAVGDTLYILDYKTSSSVYNEYIIQLAAYRQMWNEHIETKYKGHKNEKALIKAHRIKKGLILHLDKESVKPNYEEHIVHKKNLDWGWKVFKLILKMEDLKNDKAIYR